MRFEMLHKRLDRSSKVKGTRKGIHFLRGMIMLLFTFTLIPSIIQAQETIPATGGNASGSGGSVSYTIGQVLCTINTGTNGSVAQGVQQPFEISVVTAIEEAKGISLNYNYSVYPNPAFDYLILKIEGDVKPQCIVSLYDINGKVQTQCIASLYDMNGKLITTQKITGNETTIVVSNLAPAAYFLKVIQTQGTASQKEIKTFKIIKK